MQTEHHVLKSGAVVVLAAVCAWSFSVAPCQAARAPKAAKEKPAQEEAAAAGGAAGQPAAGAGELEAKRLFDRAKELMEAKETERSVKMLESILEQYPLSRIRNEVCLALGKYYIENHEQLKAIGYLNQLKTMEKSEQELTGTDKDVYLEGLYLIGVAHFQVRQYGAAFPVLRKITTEYPNTIWANQAYYYIGMCHFVEQNWNKAIEALSLVGTFVDPDSPTTQLVEAGHRLYVRIEDDDIPVLNRLLKEIKIIAETARGDKETFICIPLSSEGRTVIGSVPTEIKMPKPGDQALQVVGGDMITIKYIDENTQEGKPNLQREIKVKVVSSASLDFTLGDFESKAAAAFLDQPLCVLLQDVDLDVTDQKDQAEVIVMSRYKEEEAPDAASANTKGVDLEKLIEMEQAKFKVRDQVALKLQELGAGAVIHTGRFGGQVQLQAVQGDKPIDQTDGTLVTALDDEIVVSYIDKLNAKGEENRTAEQKILVMGDIDNRPKTSQDVVFDPLVKSKKFLVEATAYLELGRIFRSMGLIKGAKEKVTEGLDRVDFIIRNRSPLPGEIKQDAFRLKWELHMAADDYTSAISTCQLFNRLYPDSPFVDQALMGIGNIKLENKLYEDASTIFRQVLNLQKSEAKAEAQFRIAECVEARRGTGTEAAIQEYKVCAERYPESPFAGQALAKLVDYHIETKDYAQAGDLLEQIFQDYPDAGFLDSMLLKWVILSYRAGDFQKAFDKCSQLVFEYPDSSYAAKAKQIMPKIEQRLKKSGGGGTAAAGGDKEKGGEN